MKFQIVKKVLDLQLNLEGAGTDDNFLDHNETPLNVIMYKALVEMGCEPFDEVKVKITIERID